MIRVLWDVEEIVAFIDLYERTKRDGLDIDTELHHFSDILIQRAKVLGIEHDDVYRNFNGMKMMYQNVEYIASDGQHGLSGASKAFVEVYQMRNKCPYVFEMILHEFTRKYCSSPSKQC